MVPVLHNNNTSVTTIEFTNYVVLGLGIPNPFSNNSHTLLFHKSPGEAKKDQHMKFWAPDLRTLKDQYK